MRLDDGATFHEFASAWMRGNVSGVLGDKPVDRNTEADYRGG